MILVVSKPGRLRDALCALLKDSFRREMIGQVDDGLSALELVVEYNPTLILLDSHLSDDEVRLMLGQIKAKRPQTRCLVLANTGRQQQVARNAGADEVFTKGFPTTRLLSVINKLIS